MRSLNTIHLDQYVISGAIIVRQQATEFHLGPNAFNIPSFHEATVNHVFLQVTMGRNHTILATTHYETSRSSLVWSSIAATRRTFALVLHRCSHVLIPYFRSRALCNYTPEEMGQHGMVEFQSTLGRTRRSMRFGAKLGVNKAENEKECVSRLRPRPRRHPVFMLDVDFCYQESDASQVNLRYPVHLDAVLHVPTPCLDGVATCRT
ncbi:hypothetical protein AZE42_09493 [Rhizopogon vesiculosus]|uniref:Uncharacterized protein n=1 Tax=Rhizopogon vesiculosus TaxID=180088 RepID=A0A1J8Q5D2_9AGAM|nr:hypothetical protein AZE42_09493 [Rhizopogon vesiculosus]